MTRVRCHSPPVDAVILDDARPVWCIECGRPMPWKHAPAPTWRARIANPLLALLSRVQDGIERFKQAGASTQ